MTRCILTTPYFRLASQTRNAELEFCLAQNLKNQNIDTIILLTDTKITDKIILEKIQNADPLIKMQYQLPIIIKKNYIVEIKRYYLYAIVIFTLKMMIF